MKGDRTVLLFVRLKHVACKKILIEKDSRKRIARHLHVVHVKERNVTLSLLGCVIKVKPMLATNASFQCRFLREILSGLSQLSVIFTLRVLKAKK